jgi:hypothetical protein
MYASRCGATHAAKRADDSGQWAQDVAFYIGIDTVHGPDVNTTLPQRDRSEKA